MSTLGFEMEWFDQVSGLVNKLFLKFFIEDNTIEILQTNQKFLLKRIFYPEVQLKDLYIGNTVTIYNRLMTVKAHANSATTKYMKDIEVRFLCVLPKNEIAFLGQVMLLARKHELRLGKAKTISSVRMRTNVPVEAGDTILEIVGLSKIKVDDLIDEFQRSTPSIRITHATHEDTDVSTILDNGH